MSQTADGPPAPGTPAKPRRAKRRVWRRVLIAVAAVLVVALVGVGAYAWNISHQVTSNIHRGIDLPVDTPTPGSTSTPAQPRETGVLNYVLLGSDSRDEDDPAEGRSDTIMVVHLNKKRTNAYITSFPRDMYVTIPGYGKNKINAAFEEGGPALTVKTLEELTGADMDHVVLVNFEGFIDLTTDLGGVTVTNKTAFSSHGYDYPKGKVNIEGKKALWFVRERHSLPGGDLDRAENQRNVIKAIVAKGLSAGVDLRPGEVQLLHRQPLEAPDRRQQPQRLRDPLDGALAASRRQEHPAAPGSAGRLRHRERPEHRRGRPGQDGRAGQGDAGRHHGGLPRQVPPELMGGRRSPRP